MLNEPELQASMRQQLINPLRLAWGLVIFLIVIVIAWAFLSDEDQTTSKIASKNSITINTLINSEDENISKIITTYPITVVIDEVEEPKNKKLKTQLTSQQKTLQVSIDKNILTEGNHEPQSTQEQEGFIAWKEYAQPFIGSKDLPRITIIITDIGLNLNNSNEAINILPEQVGLALSPYARNIQSWMDRVRKTGHEGFLMIPTEPLSYPSNDPGPHTLMTNDDPVDNLAKLDWLLNQVTGYVGVINHMGSKFTTEEEALTPILTELQNKNLMFIDSRSTRFSVASQIAQNLGMPSAKNDRYIDNVLTKVEIQKHLDELEKTAVKLGTALGLARAVPLSINEISEWADTLANKGIELVPVTAIANRQWVK
ncbi:divergent polysaccharide deacetylase family protein [Emcibacteraceae bacterium]|nr:divergent polysaccharide deacetylase family protein [Emcibacteraceae bacterium]